MLTLPGIQIHSLLSIFKWVVVYCFMNSVINMDSDRNMWCILQASTEVLEEDNTSIWFSGKEMLRGKQLKDFIGKNEKTKIVAKIQKVQN